MPCCLLFLIFPLLCLKTKTVYLRTLQGCVLRTLVLTVVCERMPSSFFRHLVHSPKGNFLVPRCIGKPKGAHFYQPKAKHLHCMCQTEHLVHMLKVCSYSKANFLSAHSHLMGKALVKFTPNCGFPQYPCSWHFALNSYKKYIYYVVGLID